MSYPLGALTDQIIGAFIDVHKELGPGLLESSYEVCSCEELKIRGLKFRRQVPLAIRYKSIVLQEAYRIDLIIEEQVIVELKAVDVLTPVHEAQLLSYLKHTGLRVGLLINFNVPLLRDGIKRIIH